MANRIWRCEQPHCISVISFDGLESRVEPLRPCLSATCACSSLNAAKLPQPSDEAAGAITISCCA